MGAEAIFPDVEADPLAGMAALSVQAWRLLDALLENRSEEAASDAPEQAATAAVAGDGSSGDGVDRGADGGVGVGGKASGDGLSPGSGTDSDGGGSGGISDTGGDVGDSSGGVGEGCQAA